MVTQAELGDMFRRGETSGQASNVAIQDSDKTTRLVGYNWACYAIRFKATGEDVYFSGWRGYSMSTSCQLTKLGLAEYSDRTVADDPTVVARTQHTLVSEYERGELPA